MTKQKKQKKYSKYAIKQAKLSIKKYLDKNPQDIEKIKRLKSQTVEPWKRILMIILSICLFCITIAFAKNYHISFIVSLLFLFSIIIFLFGLFGNMETVERILDSADKSGAGQLIDFLAAML